MQRFGLFSCEKTRLDTSAGKAVNQTSSEVDEAPVQERSIWRRCSQSARRWALRSRVRRNYVALLVFSHENRQFDGQRVRLRLRRINGRRRGAGAPRCRKRAELGRLLSIRRQPANAHLGKRALRNGFGWLACEGNLRRLPSSRLFRHSRGRGEADEARNGSQDRRQLTAKPQPAIARRNFPRRRAHAKARRHDDGAGGLHKLQDCCKQSGCTCFRTPRPPGDRTPRLCG